MSALTDTEVDRLVEIGEKIRFGLECDANGSGLPCRTDRLAVVELMIEYLQIHDYMVVDYG